MERKYLERQQLSLSLMHASRISQFCMVLADFPLARARARVFLFLSQHLSRNPLSSTPSPNLPLCFSVSLAVVAHAWHGSIRTRTTMVDGDRSVSNWG